MACSTSSASRTVISATKAACNPTRHTEHSSEKKFWIQHNFVHKSAKSRYFLTPSAHLCTFLFLSHQYQQSQLSLGDADNHHISNHSAFWIHKHSRETFLWTGNSFSTQNICPISKKEVFLRQHRKHQFTSSLTIDIPIAEFHGDNEVKITLVDTWVNLIIDYSGKPNLNRLTICNVNNWHSHSPLQS